MLEITGLEVVYKKVVLALRGVSLRVPEGGAVALLGPNGAGKTTLLRALTGLLPVHDGAAPKGRIQFFGQSLLGLRADRVVRAGIAQVMEGRRLFKELTLEENLFAGAYHRPHAQRSAEVEQIYEQFPILGERRRERAGYLSGGEQQMTAIGRALLSRPKLLVLDEPSLGLAPKIVRELTRLIRTVHAEGVAVLLVEQNASVALDLADYGYVLENGKVVLDAPTATLRDDPDVQAFYLGVGGAETTSYRDVKLYRRRRRWLS